MIVIPSIPPDLKMLRPFYVASSGLISRAFSNAVKTIEERCDEVFKNVIEPVLAKEGTEVFFHGVKDDCAIITITGNAETTTEEWDQNLPEEILEVLQRSVPEVKYIRKKGLCED